MRAATLWAAALLSVTALPGCVASGQQGVAPGLQGVASGRQATSIPALSRPAVKPDAQTARPRAAARLINGPGQWKTLSAPVTGDPSAASRTVLEYVPPVTDPDALPVLYLLHGLPGTAAGLCTPALGAVLLAAFRAGAAPFLLACPDGNPASAGDPEWGDSPGGSRLESFVTSTAIAAVEGSAVRASGSRAIAGFSMGGFAAASIALRHPDQYGQVVSMAGYFHLDDPDHVFGADGSAHDPTALVARASRARWYLAEAANDTDALTAHDSERYSALLGRNGASVTLAVTPGGHSGSWVNQQLPAVARFLTAGWAPLGPR